MTMLKIPIKCGPRELIANIDCSSDDEDRAKSKNTSDAKMDASTTTDTNVGVDAPKGLDVSFANGALKTVGDLRKFIANEINGDSEKIKIIFRGKYIGTDFEEPLKKFKFKNTDKMMVMNVPKQIIKENSVAFQALLDYEKKHLVALNQLFDKNGEDMKELERNFLEGEMLKEMIRRMDKQLKLFNEVCERHMVNIDAIPISQEGTQEEQRLRNREKRKSLIDGIQELLNKNDKYAFRLSQYTHRVEHPNEGL